MACKVSAILYIDIIRSASHFGHVNFKKRAPCVNLSEVWMGPVICPMC